MFVTTVCPGAVATPMLDVQLPRSEAALTFSGARALTAEEVSTVILERALTGRPLELLIPAPGSGQRMFSKLVGAFPTLGSKMLPWMTRLGRRHQRRMQRTGS
ncbi:MAG: hypothetical protein IPI67_36730 [Myxococcales bacterium]|nr:hypothetical protein [Myxococcales bacterium]